MQYIAVLEKKSILLNILYYGLNNFCSNPVIFIAIKNKIKNLSSAYYCSNIWLPTILF